VRCISRKLPALTGVLGVVLCMALAGCGGGGGGVGTGGGNPPPPASFSLSLSASMLTLTASGQSLTVTLNPVNGFSSTATCSLSGLPSGVNTSPVSFSVSNGSPQQLQLSENNVASAGTSTVTVGCTSGTLSAQAQFALTVTPEASFTLSLSASPLTLTPSGQSLTVTLNPFNGFSSTVTCSFSGLPNGVNVTPASFSLSSGNPQQLQLSENNVASAGSSTVTVSCASGSLSASTQFTLTVQVSPALYLTPSPPSFTILPGNSQMVELGIGGIDGLTGPITGTVTGLPTGITVAQPTFTGLVNSVAILNFSAASTATTSGSATITVTGGAPSVTVNIPITVNYTPDFTLSSGINTVLVVDQSSTEIFTASVTDLNGFNQPIAVSFAGIPAGVTFSPSSFTLQPGASQTVQVSATFSAVANSSPTITMTGTGGGLTHQTQFILDILAAELSIGVQPNSLNVPAGSTDSFEMQVDGTPNGTGTISIQLGAPPSGVTLSPASFTVPGNGGMKNVFVETTSTASGGTLTATATYGPYTQSTSLLLTIGAAENIKPVALSTADQLVRTDALTPYNSFPPPNYLIYHAASNSFFSTDAYLNQLNVVDAATHALKTTLTIPGAFGLDQAADGSVLYVGTMLGDLYVVDPINLTILKRYPSSTISPYGFEANAVYALANGKLLLEKYFLVSGYSWVDGNGPLALWDPATNAITVFESSQYSNGTIPAEPTCLRSFENVILTNNRTRVLLVPVLTSEGSSTLCSLDPMAGTWNWSGQITGGANSALATFAVSPDGNTLVAFDGYDIYNLDPATLTVKNSFAVSASQTLLNYPVMFLSQDLSQVFITDANGADVLDVYNLASGNKTGWIPELNLASPGSYSPIPPLYQAMSSSGLTAGVIEGGGIGLLDSTAIHALPIGSRFSQTQLDVTYGPVGGGTATSWMPDEFGVPTPPLGSVYFGVNAATNLNNNGFTGLLEATSPAGTPGPVDVRTFASDGGSQLLPFGFSYGPWVIESATSYATAEGGGPGSLYGFGFGPPASNGTQSAYITPPSDLQVTVGGASATVDGYNPNPFISTYFTAPPLPTNTLLYTVPPGTAGTNASITVSNSSGTTTAPTKITYLPALQQYPVAGQLADGVYDPRRNVYYFTDVNQVRVFSLAQGAWKASIPIPAPKGAYGPQRLFGIALSPDGSKLAISDPGAIAIYIVNPDQPSSIQSFPYAAQIGYYAASEEPADVAVTNNGTVYFTTYDLVGDGAIVFYYLNPTTGLVSPVPGNLQGGNYDNPDSHLALSTDGSRVYFNIEGGVGYFDTVAGKIIFAPSNSEDIGQGGEDLVLCANQSSLFAAGMIMDSNLNNLGLQALDNAESVDADYMYGAALSSDGSLLFQPGTQFIDVFDGRTGSFRARISLPVQLSPNFRALVSNNLDSNLVAITGATGNGIAVIDLNSLPEPEPLPYITAQTSPVVSRARPAAASMAARGSAQTLTGFPRAPRISHRRSTLLDSFVRRP